MTLRVEPGPSERWSASCMTLNRVAAPRRGAFRRIFDSLAESELECGFASLEQDGEIVAEALGVIQGGFVCLCEIVTAAEQRRRGHARALVEGVCAWAAGQGVSAAWLQVVAANEPALDLYATAGFQEAYCYWYRVQPRNG